ncbi:hypothetical protein EB1_25510 [Empedobacter brevis NBRC 14943 = ATCC 43319]|uniref:Lipoprotein n=1 Tax=Empedobacter brevis NBRC 14943 = ATCC 43319 TaxID=1218108 RepID=A0A511NKJ8_9FLAO|nr:hypothetical protein [Empedobacter brevis]GEM52761.1 hypothetical protein EB1_25510 [Empedobacter brevis NBRC 14943 = ATCC 43319]
MRQIKNIPTITLGILGFYFLTGCSCGNKLTSCPDGRPVSFPKNEKCAKKYYEDAVKNLDVNLKATVNVIEQVTVGVDNLGVKTEAKLLKDKLDNETIRLQETLKASFLALRSDPCGNGERHYKIIEAVNDKNYKLQEIKQNLLNTSTVEQKQETLGGYARGKEDGKNMRILVKAIEKYYTDNQKYPATLSDLNINDVLLKLGNSRLDYKLNNENSFLLIFAGEDYLLHTSDDKVYKGINENTEQPN